MGTPLERLVFQPGNPCPICWGFGQTFGDTFTPADPQVQLHDWSEGTGFLEIWRDELTDAHRVVQTVNPCIWTLDTTHFRWTWQYSPTGTNAAVVLLPALITAAFLATPLTPCVTIVDNEIVNPAAPIIFAGFATINFTG